MIKKLFVAGLFSSCLCFSQNITVIALTQKESKEIMDLYTKIQIEKMFLDAMKQAILNREFPENKHLLDLDFSSDFKYAIPKRWNSPETSDCKHRHR